MSCRDCGAPDDQGCRRGCTSLTQGSYSEPNRVGRVLDALNITARHASQVSVEFFRGMASRMAMSFEKYGDVKEAYPHKVNAIDSLHLRLEKYHETGNTEYLMDVANFAMIEYMYPAHPKHYFKAEDSAASPGRVDHTGIQSQAANTIGRENTRRGGFYKHEGD